MTKFLIQKFIKNPDDINNLKVRRNYGTLSSVVGIICNVFLFILKYIMGTLSGSISVVSDAFNNLSDSAGCMVTLLGYKLASKPADKDHPFGHGRMEYLTALTIAVLILIVAFELFRNSVNKIIHPEKLTFSLIVLISLLVSILIKLWMSFFNAFLGKKINSSVMLAAAKDSRTDVIATSATCIAVISSLYTNLPVDGIMGLVVSLFIFKSGIDIVKDTVDNLLGKPVDSDIVYAIKEMIGESDKIIGIHDLVVHNYGPGNMIGSLHAEVKSNEDFVFVHDMIDELERRIHRELNILMTIHMDPIETDNEQVNLSLDMIRNIILDIDPCLQIHDFRLIFDIVVPYDCKYNNDDIKELIDKQLDKMEDNYYTVITFDREY